jgi:hypothetical protein
MCFFFVNQVHKIRCKKAPHLIQKIVDHILCIIHKHVALERFIGFSANLAGCRPNLNFRSSLLQKSFLGAQCVISVEIPCSCYSFRCALKHPFWHWVRTTWNTTVILKKSSHKWTTKYMAFRINEQVHDLNHGYSLSEQAYISHMCTSEWKTVLPKEVFNLLARKIHFPFLNAKTDIFCDASTRSAI